VKQQPYRKLPIPCRNDPCPCKSGKKAKHCCLDKIKMLAAIPPHLRDQFLAAQILSPVVVVAPPPGPVTVEDAVAEASEKMQELTEAKIAEALGCE
jgi:hypothetical protein